MEKCIVKDCSHNIYKYAKDSRCIFHTTTGKTNIFTRHLIRKRLRGEELVTAHEIADGFIREFTVLLEKCMKTKSDLNCTGFVFPKMHLEQWSKMWQPVTKVTQQHLRIFWIDFPISFKEATFYSNVRFFAAEFLKNLNFEKTIINGSANFTDAVFHDAVTFEKTCFNKDTSFFGAEFNKSVSFFMATFREQARFTGARFLRNAEFNQVEFKDSVFFGGAFFAEKAHFCFSQFNSTARFDSAYFSGYFSAHGSKFSGPLEFSSVYIESIGIFASVIFEDKINFKKTIFSTEAYFESVKFYSDVEFAEFTTQLLDLTKCEIFSFLRLRNVKNISSKSSTPIILLRDLKFWQSGYLILEDMDLSNTTFWQTVADIIQPRITFIRDIWHKDKIILDDTSRDEYKKWKKITLSDNIWKRIYEVIDKSPNKTEEIERCYRQIRLAYEANGEYPDAGDFYRKEMNVRMKKLRSLLKILQFLYALISRYGESISCAIFWFIIFWLFFATLFAFAGFEKTSEIIQLLPRYNINYFGKTVSVIVDSCIAILNAVTLGRMDPYKPLNSFGSAILVFSRIFLISILTLLLLAIRRRFRR